MLIRRVTPIFCEHFPQPLIPGALYVSMSKEVVLHLCACGCGVPLVTPLALAGWIMVIRPGTLVSLMPPVRNVRGCGSHYWITDNEVCWIP